VVKKWINKSDFDDVKEIIMIKIISNMFKFVYFILNNISTQIM